MVNVALDWFFIAGEQLFKYQDDPSNKEMGQGFGAGVGPLWNGPDGYSDERWDFWAQRLKAASEDGTLALHTRVRAADGGQMLVARRG